MKIILTLVITFIFQFASAIGEKELFEQLLKSNVNNNDSTNDSIKEDNEARNNSCPQEWIEKYEGNAKAFRVKDLAYFYNNST